MDAASIKSIVTSLNCSFVLQFDHMLTDTITALLGRPINNHTSFMCGWVIDGCPGCPGCLGFGPDGCPGCPGCLGCWPLLPLRGDDLCDFLP